MARVLRYGEQSILIEEIDPNQYLKQLIKALPEAKVRAGLESLIVIFPASGDYVAKVESALKDLKPEADEASGKLFIIPVEYNGEDLAVAAELADVGVEQLVSAHTAITWKVKLIGFAPGFPYLVPTEDTESAKLLETIGRLAVPRRQVPAGSVGIAAGMSCIYPDVMPGGWHLIGTSSIALFDATNKDQPNLLSIGDLVKFEVVN